jgi:hypothetical protein
MAEHVQNTPPVRRCAHDAHRLTLYILAVLVAMASTGCAGKKTVTETSIGQLGCGLSDRHSLFSYSGSLCDTLDWFELDIDSQRPTRRLVRRANASATARQTDTTATASVTVTHAKTNSQKHTTIATPSPSWYTVTLGIVLLIILLVLIRKS